MAMTFNNIPKPAQVIIFFMVSAILAGVVFWFKVFPLEAQRDDLQNAVTALHAENQKNQAVEQERTEYLNRIAQLEKQLETLRSIVPDEQATDDFMKMIFEVGTAASINIRTFIPQAVVPRDFYVEMPFNLRLDGTYYSLVSFFNRLSHEQRIVSVTGLSLGAPAGGGMGNYQIHPYETVGANCVATTYFNKQTSGAAPPQK
jgi:type IV pilus assembly protein PilO